MRSALFSHIGNSFFQGKTNEVKVKVNLVNPNNDLDNISFDLIGVHHHVIYLMLSRCT